MSPHATATPTATQNACKVCAPLGACLAFRGVEGAIPLVHGSQGCATYIRRYMIGHFREPMDVASSSFGERSAIFGGKDNLHKGLKNVIKQYKPRLIGVASSCLSETIGDDLRMLVRQFQEDRVGNDDPVVVPVSTPSYAGTHDEGFHATVRAIIDRLTTTAGPRCGSMVNVLPGIVSPADIRHLKEILRDFGLDHVVLPDYSDTLDGPAVAEYEPIPSGGSPLRGIARMAQADATLVLSSMLSPQQSGGALLEERFGVPERRLGLPIGVRQTDRFFRTLEDITGRPTPPVHALERGRLVDSYVDAHKYVFGKRVVVYGEEDLVVGLAAFLDEIGAVPIVCASGGHSGRMQKEIAAHLERGLGETVVLDGADFADITEAAAVAQPDLLLGNSKGYSVARQLGVPLVRVGFPIHDRMGGQRVLHLSYRGAQQLFDRIANELLRRMQDDCPVGHAHY
ncbi:MAG: nitrogenase [Chloroflexota bacterium]|nr:MAG: nitrogenase [Chloroflexota bacterium]